MLNLKNVSVSIGEKKVLETIDTVFEPGKVYAIMGPNGSGKSTLAGSIMGNPAYTLSLDSCISFQGQEIQSEDPDERARRGIFLSHQSPLSLSGVSVQQLLRYALEGKRDPLELRKETKKYAEQLRIPEELLSRSLNDGFSGGERKKMEVLQCAVLNPSFAIFDEIDTGVDVDALKTIADFLNQWKSSEKTLVFITHYTRLLHLIRPDVVRVIKDGKLAVEGGFDLAEKIEREGYQAI